TSTGVTAGVFGFLAAHEMIHSADRRERALGLTFLASVFYMHFRVAHIFGHHRHAATPEDAATARLGEGLYAFLGRTIPGQFREAWRSERRRLRRRGRQPLRPGNRVALYALIELAIMAALAFISWRALAFVFGTAAIAVVLLESFNYVAHYGLTRQSLPGGRYEALGPQHSWNSGRWMNNAALFNMGRHSDHHRKTTRPFDQLTAVNDQAELPFGYAGAILTAFIPPLWRRIMDPRAAAAMGGYLPSEPSVPVR
ncbi:MAG TPA: alkane 1-monooxygenase, partial [Sphingomicrobium sp.]